MKSKKYFLLLALIGLGLRPLCAAQPLLILGEAEMNWPGIDYQITVIKRIPPDRLLLVVRVLATAKAPPEGTLIGFPVPVPPGTDPAVLASGRYHPRPLSLVGSVMVDDITQQKYPALSPISPPGRGYLPGQVLGFLKPSQNLIMTVQFTIPPPPPPPPPGPPPIKPTVSFLFTNAKGPIKKIVVPPPLPAAGAAAAPAPATSP